EMLKLAEHILEGKEADFDPSEFVDHYEQALTEFIKKKQAKQPVMKSKAAPQVATNVVNLMDALRKSVQGGGKVEPKAKKGKKRIEGQREMLLPIAGKGNAREAKGAKETAKEAKGGARTAKPAPKRARAG
ncbi:MAG: Ku protein, partial [Xanthobacteraceae bacterium]